MKTRYELAILVAGVDKLKKSLAKRRGDEGAQNTLKLLDQLSEVSTALAEAYAEIERLRDWKPKDE